MQNSLCTVRVKKFPIWFCFVPFSAQFRSVLFKSGEAKRGFSQNSNRGKGNTYYDKSSCLDKTCTCTFIFPLLWVWSVDVEIIDYKLNEKH